MLHFRSTFGSGLSLRPPTHLQLLATGLALTAAATLVVSTSAAEASTTQTSSCTDGGKHLWHGRSVWGAEYGDAAGVRRVVNDLTSFTSSAADATTVDYSVKGYDGAGTLIYSTTVDNKAFDFKAGTAYLDRNPRNPPSAPGKARVVVDVGDGNDGHSNCTMTFVQPAVTTPETKPSPTPSPTANPSSSSMPVGDLPGWRQIFTDDFTAGNVARGSWPGTYGTKWGAYGEGWPDTSRNGIYSPRRVLSISDGKLDMWLHTEGAQPYVAAPQPKIKGPGTDAGAGQTYGRYSVRFRADALHGYKTAWLLWPVTDNWNEGEIDFPEGNLDSSIHAFSHEVGPNPANNAFQASTSLTYPSWHVATTEWTSTGVTFYLDGVNLGTATRSGVPKTPMRWVLQTETNLDGYKPAASAAGHVQIDWVAVWSKA